MRKRSRVDIVRSFDGSLPSERITNFKKYVGVSLDFEIFVHLQLLVALVDADDETIPKIIEETIIIEDHINKYQFYGD